jgi:hypothetical protein
MKYKPLFVFLLFINFCFAQKKEFNFVIVVDGDIVKHTYGKIVMEDINNTKDIIKCNIIAGELNIDESDSDKLFSKSNSKMAFEFGYSKRCGEDVKYYNYTIEDFKANWLNDGFFILYIYNTDDKKYKKIYNPLAGKNYTYDYDSSVGSMRRVQKKKTKEQKECEYKE